MDTPGETQWLPVTMMARPWNQVFKIRKEEGWK
jgi:hypothetical protein